MPNQLSHSTSPYLQQHANNPVAWQEWGPIALQQARDTGKPILLSVGYSACHWCHVMAHESFEDEAIAELMNRLFINIKVDREERPDIDQIYQSAHHLLTRRSGGWPLTMFLTPDTSPFFSGTYFPREPRYGLPGFGELLSKVEHYFRENTSAIHEHNAKLFSILNQPAGMAIPPSTFSNELIKRATQQLADTFDERAGGFGEAPKFPHPESLTHCLKQYITDEDIEVRERARHMACFTLEQMCKGGIYDQLGGGFARYSVDAEWGIPHFEKMLYDNGPLLRLVSDASLIAENPAQQALFATVAAETATWVMREMQSQQPGEMHGYYSTIDADSEGHEGKFYVWTDDEIKSLLTQDEYQLIRTHYNLSEKPNFEGEYWHLTVRHSLRELAARENRPSDRYDVLLHSAREKLFAAREKRIRPGRDEKILVSWNALMVEGMAHAGRVLNQPAWIASARQALLFIHETMWTGKRLLAVSKDGKTHLNAYLDDYAFLLQALIEMLQADFRAEDLHWAEDIAEVLLDQFEDKQHGGFFFTSHDHEVLIQRPKPVHDNATPSGNGIAAMALQRLFHLTGEIRYQHAAERTVGAFYTKIEQYPMGCCSLLAALEELLIPPRLIIIRGNETGVGEWKTALNALYMPATLILGIAESQYDQGKSLPIVLQPPQQGKAGQVNAYVCEGVSCSPPYNTLAALQDRLKISIVRPD